MPHGDDSMSYYFTNDPGKRPNRKEICFRFLGNTETFISDDGIFSKSTLDYGSRVLLETIITYDLKGSVLDLGCGLGYMGIMLKKYHPDLQINMIDINETAVQLAMENSRLYRQDNRVYANDGLTGVSDQFDVIVCNPPIRTGKQNIYRLLAEAVDHLEIGGVLYSVIRKKQGAESALNYLNTISETKVINREGGYWIMESHRMPENDQ